MQEGGRWLWGKKTVPLSRAAPPTRSLSVALDMRSVQQAAGARAQTRGSRRWGPAHAPAMRGGRLFPPLPNRDGSHARRVQRVHQAAWRVAHAIGARQQGRQGTRGAPPICAHRSIQRKHTQKRPPAPPFSHAACGKPTHVERLLEHDGGGRHLGAGVFSCGGTEGQGSNRLLGAGVLTRARGLRRRCPRGGLRRQRPRRV